MSTTPTRLPVPSEKPQDLKFNSGKIDEFVTSMAQQYIDRHGGAHYTIEGLKQLVLQHIYNLGWTPVGTFQGGAILTTAGDIIQDESTSVWYRWDDLTTLPKTVTSGSTPASTGGTGAGKWMAVDVSDVLRMELSNPDGLKLIGRCQSVAELRTVEPDYDRQLISLVSHTSGTGYGGGVFEADFSDTTTADNDGTIIVTSGGRRWKRKYIDINPEFFGAYGDGTHDDSIAIKASDKAAYSLNVKFVANSPLYKITGIIPLKSIPVGDIKTTGGILYIKGDCKNTHISTPITPAIGAGQNTNSVFRRYLEFVVTNQPTTVTKRPQGLAIDNINNKVYIAYDTGTDKGQVWKYSRNGVVDTSFGQAELTLKHAAGAGYRYSNNKVYVCSGGSAYGLEVYELSSDGKSISKTIDLSAYGAGGLMAIDNDNDILVTGSNLNGEYWFRFFNFETGELLWSVKDPTSYAVAGNPQGLVVYSGYLFYVTDNGVHIIDFEGFEVDFWSVSIIGEAQGVAILQDSGVVSLALMRENGSGSTPILYTMRSGDSSANFKSITAGSSWGSSNDQINPMSIDVYEFSFNSGVFGGGSGSQLFNAPVIEQVSGKWQITITLKMYQYISAKAFANSTVDTINNFSIDRPSDTTIRIRINDLSGTNLNPASLAYCGFSVMLIGITRI